MSGIVLHLKPNDASPELRGWHMRLYREIVDLAEHRGIPTRIQQRDKDITVDCRSIGDDRFKDGNLHIIDDRSVSAANVLNASVAYFWEFWHLDPLGTKAFSSIRKRDYDPNTIREQRAARFVENLRKRYVDKRRSKYDQPSHQDELPSGAVAVFLQGKHPLASGATDKTDLDMVALVQDGAGDRPIIVKPHPLLDQSREIRQITAAARQDSRLHLTQANVHDILKASDATVSFNSTVALEGYMHGVPAVLLGQSDFHHLAHPAQCADDVQTALTQSTPSKSDFARYLAWYFLGNCLALNHKSLHAKILETFKSAGFDWT